MEATKNALFTYPYAVDSTFRVNDTTVIGRNMVERKYEQWYVSLIVLAQI